MSTFISDEPKMYEAYTTGKDLYAIIAQSAFNNNYEDNLEFYVPGKVIEIDGKQVVTGSGKSFEVVTDENDTITIKYYEMLETTHGDVAAQDLQIGDQIKSDCGLLTICGKVQNADEINFTFSQ